MCGIAALWMRESVPSVAVIHKMLQWCEKRGVDGTGISLLRKEAKGWIVQANWKDVASYSKLDNDLMKDIMTYKYEVGDVMLMICRAQPETEAPTSARNMQPIIGGGCALIHNGAVSQKQFDEANLMSHYMMITDIDSETIISEYLRNGRDIKLTQESLSGGFAYVMVDLHKGQMYVVNDFKPLATGYVKGVGYLVASDNDCLSDVVQDLTDCPRTGMNVWEYYYNNPQKGPLIRMVDLESGFEQHIKFRPRFKTATWDSIKTLEEKDELCLVACSGGLDSTLTLATLKAAGYKDVVAVHFKYGHRGQEAEEIAIKKSCKYMNVPLKIFDLENVYKECESKETSMLMDDSLPIRTGTPIALKTTEAWVPGRNMMFVTVMATLAESLVMKYDYGTVNVLGGFLNLTESGTYPDNSEDFLRSFLSFVKYGTLCGDRFKPLYCLSNLMKSEQWLLVQALGFEDVISNTISCDRPIVRHGIPYNCAKDGIPACGSGLLSYWGAKMAGMKGDPRMFYEIEGDYIPHIPKHLIEGAKRNIDINQILDRILLPADKIKILKGKVLDK